MMNRTTGQAMAPGAHLRQSIAEILSTPIGSRVMRRDFGSLLPALIDQPGNASTVARVAAAAAAALMRWEPRLGLVRITLAASDTPGRATVHITASLADLAGTRRPLALAVDLGPTA